MRRYQTPHALAPETGAVITDTLETIAREGARRMLEHALRAEVDEAPRTRPLRARRSAHRLPQWLRPPARDRHRDLVGRGPGAPGE